MSGGAEDGGGDARNRSRAKLDHSSLALDRMPGLRLALDSFAAEAPGGLKSVFGVAFGAGRIEALQETTLFQALRDCAGLTAAIYASAETGARLLIALDERIDDLVVASIFGESLAFPSADESASDGERGRTAIETALVEAFARELGAAIESAFAPISPLALAFERLTALTDLFALGRRDGAAAAARISLPMAGGAGECLLLLPQSFLSPLRKALERNGRDETPVADRRWSRLMEQEVRQARLPVDAILEEVPMTLGELARLRAGALLPFRNAGLDAVRLDCSGRGVFLCKLGQGEGRYRLEVISPIPPAFEPPEAQTNC